MRDVIVCAFGPQLYNRYMSHRERKERPSKKDKQEGLTKKRSYLGKGRQLNIGVPITMPNSLFVLPEPMWLSDENTKELRSLEHSILVAQRVKPGTFAEFPEVINILLPVHDRLLEETERLIPEFDGNKLIIRLYDELEIMYGTLEKHRIQGMAASAIWHDKRIPMALRHEWMARSPQTVGVKYLIESTIKNGTKGRKPLSDEELLKLMSLGTRITEIDGFMEHVYHKVIPHELSISKSLQIKTGLSKFGVRALKGWNKAKKEREYEKILADLSGRQKAMEEPIKESQLTEERIWKTLDEPMKRELGYSLTDQLQLNKALIAYFDDFERLKVVAKEEFARYLSQYTGLDTQTLNLLLSAHSLSRRNLVKLGRLDMLPVEHFWRDTRLINRPIVEIKEGSVSHIVLGIETVLQGMLRHFQLLTDTRASILGVKPNGPIVHAFGIINEKAGNLFRDDVIRTCRLMGFGVEGEKGSVGGIKVPKNIGPVDVFIWDKLHGRFVIVETKDLSERITPKDLARQKEQFVGERYGNTKCFLGKLRAQEDWFRNRMVELKREYGISYDDKVTVEGVLVMNHPMLWLFGYDEEIPVLDDREFFKRLKGGKRLVYNPHTRHK